MRPLDEWTRRITLKFILKILYISWESGYGFAFTVIKLGAQ